MCRSVRKGAIVHRPALTNRPSAPFAGRANGWRPAGRPRPILLCQGSALRSTIGALIMLLAYWHHARHSPSPVLDLNLLSIKTFNIGTVTGGICRMGLDATPFMLPLLFQVGFGLSPIEAMA